MNELDVDVIVSGTAPDNLAFAYQAADPAQPTAKYLDPKTGNISVPKGVTNLRIAFHLKPRSIDASFDLGQSANGKALTIWTVEPGKSTKMKPDPPDFGPVGVSTTNPPMSVSVIDRNQLPGPIEYEYQLTVGVRVNGVIHRIPTPDPKIRNGSDRIAISLWMIVGITVLVLAGLFALYAWNRHRLAGYNEGAMGGTPTTSGGMPDREALSSQAEVRVLQSIQVNVKYDKNEDPAKEFTYSRAGGMDSRIGLTTNGDITVPENSGPVVMTFRIHADSRDLAFAKVPFEIYASNAGEKDQRESTEFGEPIQGSDWPKSFTIVDRNTRPCCGGDAEFVDYVYKLHFTRVGGPDLATPDPKIRNGGIVIPTIGAAGG